MGEGMMAGHRQDRRDYEAKDLVVDGFRTLDEAVRHVPHPQLGADGEDTRSSLHYQLRLGASSKKPYLLDA